MSDYTSTERDKYTTYWAHEIGRKLSPGLDAVWEFIREAEERGIQTVLDVGCGGGWPAQELLEAGFDVTPFDIAENALDQITERAVSEELRSRFVRGCIWDMPFIDREFECIFCTDVLEHLPTEMIDAALGEMARIAEMAYCEWADFQDFSGSDIVGSDMHLTLEPLEWWESKFKAHWHTVEIGSRGIVPIIRNHRNRRLSGGWAWLG